jgi:hypothetical protein
MKLICIACGNRLYFELEEETVKELCNKSNGLIIQNAIFDDWDQTDEMIRENLNNILDYIMNENSSFLSYDYETECYYNPMIFCAKCGSARVVPPYSSWSIKSTTSVDQDILNNRQEYINLRKERKQHENLLPVLWQQGEISDSSLGKMHF